MSIKLNNYGREEIQKYVATLDIHYLGIPKIEQKIENKIKRQLRLRNSFDGYMLIDFKTDDGNGHYLFFRPIMFDGLTS